jgi:hypothetical protein
MDHRIDLLRVPPAPRFSPLYVYYSGTINQIQIYADKELSIPITQPIILDLHNVHWYCAENARVDIKIENKIYSGGFILIEDQLMYNPATVMDLTYTMLDGTVCIDQNGNIYQEAI